MKGIRCFLCVSILPVMLSAGPITIEKNDSLYRNELFNEKRSRAEQYNRREAARDDQHRTWSSRLDPSCALLKDHYLIYFCANNGRYYKGGDPKLSPSFRALSTSEVKKIRNEKD